MGTYFLILFSFCCPRAWKMCCKVAKHKVLYSVVQQQGQTQGWQAQIPDALCALGAAFWGHWQQLFALFLLCPSTDTSFMYMIAGLCMLKLYQTRHPDINASAYSAYASFAVVISLAVLGVVWLPLTHLLLWEGDGMAGNVA